MEVSKRGTPFVTDWTDHKPPFLYYNSRVGENSSKENTRQVVTTVFCKNGRETVLHLEVLDLDLDLEGHPLCKLTDIILIQMDVYCLMGFIDPKFSLSFNMKKLHSLYVSISVRPNDTMKYR